MKDPPADAETEWAESQDVGGAPVQDSSRGGVVRRGGGGSCCLRALPGWGGLCRRVRAGWGR